MAQAVFNIKSGDRKPYLRATLRDANGVAVSLGAATVRFIMRIDFSQPPKVNALAVVISPAGGVVEYQWAAGDTDAPGEYRGEFLVEHATGLIETFPNDGYIRVAVLQRLGSPPPP